MGGGSDRSVSVALLAICPGSRVAPVDGGSTTHELSRKPPLGGVWGAALFNGGLGLVALVLFLRVMNRLVRLPSQRTDDLTNIPFVTLGLWLLMSAVVAGIVEESSFRGYMQGPIERRHGPLVAILVTGSLFAFGSGHQSKSLFRSLGGFR
jgi:membrane protease YdiL (CAAX protease family)